MIRLRRRFLRTSALLIAILSTSSLVHAANTTDWSLTDKDGKRYTLAALRGKWVLVNFWAPWCEPCLQEMPDLAELQRGHKNLLVIGVAVMYGNRKEAMDVVKRLAITYPIALGNDHSAAAFGQLDGLPTSFLYTPEGKLVGHHQGILRRNDIEKVIGMQAFAPTLFTR